MDEPLSNLDAKLRVPMRAEIASLQRNLGVTTVYVTHDQVEAMTMGDRVAVLKDGYLRPEDFEDAAIATTAAADRRMTGQVKLVEALGSELMVHFTIDAKTVNSGDPDAPEQELGEGIANAVARFSPRFRVHPDVAVEIAVSTDNLHSFDAQTRERIH